MGVTLVGLGCGGWDGVTREGAAALEQADAVLGAARLLDSLPDTVTARRIQEARSEELFRLLREGKWRQPCVVYSGDTGFYSGTRLLVPLLEQAEMEFRVLPGVSSVQTLSARLGRPWQDWSLYTAHGVNCDTVAAVSRGKPAFFLTGTDDHTSPAGLCAQLDRAGLGTLSVTVGENLGTVKERLVRTTAAEAAGRVFAPLSVLLAEPAPVPYPSRTAGIPDGDFLRGNVPMTKQEVRAVILSKLAVRPEDTVWDVGAGTGSVSVELARAAYRGRVFAVERNQEACGLIRRNRERFGAWNLSLIPGTAPEALAHLPPPDAVFVGGTGGQLNGILDAVLEKNPRVRLCVSAVTLETLSAAVTAFTDRELPWEAAQIAVSRTKTAGTLHLLAAQNPVFLITIGTAEGV